MHTLNADMKYVHNSVGFWSENVVGRGWISAEHFTHNNTHKTLAMAAIKAKACSSTAVAPLLLCTAVATRRVTAFEIQLTGGLWCVGFDIAAGFFVVLRFSAFFEKKKLMFFHRKKTRLSAHFGSKNYTRLEKKERQPRTQCSGFLGSNKQFFGLFSSNILKLARSDVNE